jgi:hypothetical protein
MIPRMASHRHGRTTRALAVCLALAAFLGVAALRAETLGELLGAVAADARFSAPTRADVRIECPSGCPASGGEAILLGRGDTLYVETKGGQRALIRPGSILVAEGGKAVAAKAGQPLADTDVLLEDLSVFSPASLRTPQISDDGPAGVVVTAAPAAGSVYALLVHTVDRERNVIVRTLYYRDAINDLSKTRRDTGFTRVAGGWRPGDVSVESVRQARKTHLTLSWREAPEAPAALFEPAGLEQPSGLRLP